MSPREMVVTALSLVRDLAPDEYITIDTPEGNIVKMTASEVVANILVDIHLIEVPQTPGITYFN